MDSLARAAVVRVLASMTDSEFDDLVQEARGDGSEPIAADYHAVVAELQGQPDPRKVAAVDALRRSGGRSKPSVPVTPTDPKKAAAADALRRIVGGH